MRRCQTLLAGLIVTSATVLVAQTNLKPRDLNTSRTFPKVTARTLWEERAREIREQVLVSCGLWPMPEKNPLHAKIFGRIEREDYTIEKVYFQPSPGLYLAGNLFRPRGKGNGPFPGVLIPHGHWKEGRLVDASDASIPALGISFARQGMVAFAYDMVGFNDTRFADSPTNKPFYDVHRMFGTNRTDELWNISLMGLQTWNSIRALDFLESLPDVDKKRLACTGASGGGTQTFMLGAIDDRLAAQAPVCMVSHTMQGGCSCENAPGLRVEYSNMEIAAAAAPRPQILIAATGDWTKTMMEVEGPAIEEIYELFGAKDRLRYARFDFGHNYNQTSREAVYDWFGRWLAKWSDPPKEQLYRKESDADLRVFPDGKLPDDALPTDKFVESLKTMHRERWQKLIPRTKAEAKNFRTIVPAWKHTLQANWSPYFDRMTQMMFARDTNASRRVSVVIAHPEGRKHFEDKGGELAGFPKQLQQSGAVVVFSDPNRVAKLPDPFANFFTTYNRTELQLRVSHLASICDGLRSKDESVFLVLVGFGRAGLWSQFSAPVADAVVSDCDQFDASSDEALLAPDLFCPGLRNIGTFQGAAMLAAPHPLLLHNVDNKFPTDDIRATYRALGASDKLRIEAKRLTDGEIADWVSRLK